MTRSFTVKIESWPKNKLLLEIGAFAERCSSERSMFKDYIVITLPPIQRRLLKADSWFVVIWALCMVNNPSVYLLLAVLSFVFSGIYPTV